MLIDNSGVAICDDDAPWVEPSENDTVGSGVFVGSTLRESGREALTLVLAATKTGRDGARRRRAGATWSEDLGSAAGMRRAGTGPGVGVGVGVPAA